MLRIRSCPTRSWPLSGGEKGGEHNQTQHKIETPTNGNVAGAQVPADRRAAQRQRTSAAALLRLAPLLAAGGQPLSLVSESSSRDRFCQLSQRHFDRGELAFENNGRLNTSVSGAGAPPSPTPSSVSECRGRGCGWASHRSRRTVFGANLSLQLAELSPPAPIIRRACRRQHGLHPPNRFASTQPPNVGWLGG
jgi:hypothetical protein